MINKLKFSFPPRIALAILTVSLISLTFVVSRYLARGTVIIGLDKPNGYIVIDGEQYNSPFQSILKSGKKTIFIGAPGYVETQKNILVPTFRQTKKYDFRLTEELLFEGDDETTDQEAIFKKYLFAKELPFSNGRFRIDFPLQDGTFQITLYAILNRADQIPDYQKQLDTYGKEALDWFVSKGIDPKSLKIEWLPERPPSIDIGVSAPEQDS